MFKKMLLTLTVLLGCAGLFGFSKGVSAGTIKISNATYDAPTISASINTYGDGHSGYYDIDWYTPETWSRSDSRGNIIAVKDRGTLYTYYSRPSGNYSYYYGDLYNDDVYPRTPITKLKTTTDFTPTGSSQIKVSDYAGTDVQVGISTWDGGQSGYYSLSHGDTEKWSRDFDARGYLLYIKFSGNSKTYVYYVPNSNKEIGVYGLNNLVIDGNQPLQELYAF